jgi:formylglycine-generating enzyme required for sulfatase activity
MSTPSTRIFVSHSTQDNSWCRPFVETLKRDGFDVWYDEQGLSGGAAWVETLQSEVQARDVFVLVLSPDSWASPWVQEEVQLAIATRRTILPIMHKTTNVQGFLLTRQWIDAVDLDPAITAQRVIGALLVGAPPPVAQAPKQRMAAPEILTPYLQRLGYAGSRIDDVTVLTPPLCDVPGGPFLMGSDPRRDPEAHHSEQPQRTVEVAAFRIARFPVTVAEYYWAIQAGPVKEPPEWERQLQRPEHPVVQISWKGAVAYSAWLTSLTGEPWRVPTEEEWEKAARGTDGRIYPWGDRWEPSRANTDDGGAGDTTPVGAYPGGVSPYGVFDMAGTVNEWCGIPPNSPMRRPSAWDDEPAGSGGYLAGGSWNDSPVVARAAHRSQLFIGVRTNDTGMRLVLPGASS